MEEKSDGKNKIEIKIFSKKYLISLLNYSPIELENIACAICCCLSLNIYIKDIIKVLPKIIKPKGRLEEVGKLKNIDLTSTYFSNQK